MFGQPFDPSQELKNEKAEKLARDIVVQIVETSRMLGRTKFLDIDPAQKLDIAKCAVKTLGKVRAEEIEARIRYLLSKVTFSKKEDLIKEDRLPKWK